MDDLDLLFDAPADTTQDKGGKASEGLNKSDDAPPQGEDGEGEEEGEKAKESTQGDGTADEEAAKAAAEEKAKGVLPKELEPHKDLIDSRKLDLTKPEGVAKLAQSYKEAEQFASRAQTQSKNSQDKASRVMSIASGSIEDLNKWRKSQGLSEFKTETRSYEDREKELTELYDNVEKSLQGDKTALAWLNKHFSKAERDLAIAKARAQDNPGKSPDQAFADRKRVGQANWGSAVGANKEAKVFFDELTDHLSPGGVFDSLGIDVLDAASTPERLSAFIELGQAVHIAKNIDKIVGERVKAELDRQRTARNAGPTGAKGGKAATTKDKESEKVADLTHLFD